jgi:hypothetical protein
MAQLQSGEAHFIKAHLNDHIGAWKASLSLNESLSIGVIAPYRKQATLLKEVLDEEEGHDLSTT